MVSRRATCQIKIFFIYLFDDLMIYNNNNITCP